MFIEVERFRENESNESNEDPRVMLAIDRIAYIRPLGSKSWIFFTVDDSQGAWVVDEPYDVLMARLPSAAKLEPPRRLDPRLATSVWVSRDLWMILSGTPFDSHWTPPRPSGLEPSGMTKWKIRGVPIAIDDGLAGVRYYPHGSSGSFGQDSRLDPTTAFDWFLDQLKELARKGA